MLAVLVPAIWIGAIQSVQAQVAGSSTTIGVSVVEATRIAQGWSVKRSILGKSVYNDGGEQIGKVEDLIIAPDKNVSYLIIGAGGFVGIGRHDVAIAASQVSEKSGRLVLAGATKEIVQAMPRFDYADETITREQFMADARQDIAHAKASLTGLQKKAASAASDVKTKLDQQAAGLQKDLKMTEDKVAEMNRAAANRWRELEGGVKAATTRLRKSVEALAG